jgi:hypothetical protein
MANRLSAPCLECGNPLRALDKVCPFCGSLNKPVLSKKEAGIYTINLEITLPTVEQAIHQFDQSLDNLNGTAIAIVKVIHGYGSSGKGGRIKEAIRQELLHQRRNHIINSYYAGEDLLPGKEIYQELLRHQPQIKNILTKDIFGNPGITLIILKRS